MIVHVQTHSLHVHTRPYYALGWCIRKNDRINELNAEKVLVRSLVMLAELSTLIKEIQAVLNDRPLTVINRDVYELQPLTPNHLIVGFNITSLPHPSLDSDDYDPNFGDHHAASRAQHYRTTLYRHFIRTS